MGNDYAYTAHGNGASEIDPMVTYAGTPCVDRSGEAHRLQGIPSHLNHTPSITIYQLNFSYLSLTLSSPRIGCQPEVEVGDETLMSEDHIDKVDIGREQHSRVGNVQVSPQSYTQTRQDAALAVCYVPQGIAQGLGSYLGIDTSYRWLDHLQNHPIRPGVVETWFFPIFSYWCSLRQL